MRAREWIAALCLLPVAIGACGWDPARPFDRQAPEVKLAIAELDAGDASAAADTLETYLSTGACKEGSIGLPESVRRLPNGAFDLGLALFRVGEAFGQRFGDETKESKDSQDGDEAHQRRAAQIACALAVVQHVASDGDAPLELRAHARYLEGNLDFLGGDYEAAVAAYDQALTLAPGIVDAGDPVGRDAAWNRAIALRRIEDEKDAGKDSSTPDGSNGGDGSSPSPDASSQPDSGPGDSGSNGPRDSGTSPDGGSGGQDAAPPPPPPEEDSGPQPQPKQNQDDRILDQFENAPTVQQEEAKKRAQQRRVVRGAEDK